ncbi:MAG: dihydrodipicolinate synthase family protein [Chloroflexi bacterium]|nr:dihydrodipicolinate synthase family protein [Chloroflexota bacterium]
MNNKFKGIIPPLITSFDEDGKFNETAQREVIQFLLTKVNGFYPIGTYGSGPLLDVEERKTIAKFIVNEVNGKVPVIIHIGAVNTKQAVDLAKHAESIGADAIGAIPPYYYSYTDYDLLEYYRAILSATKLPFFAYNNPGLSNNPLSPKIVNTLAKEGLYGIKDSSFDLITFSNFVNNVEKENFHFIIGTEAFATAAVNAGAEAVISGLANAWPEIMGELWKALEVGEMHQAGKLQLKVLKARTVMKSAPTLVVCYEILRMRGINAGYPRLPFHLVDLETRMNISKSLKELGLSI